MKMKHYLLSVLTMLLLSILISSCAGIFTHSKVKERKSNKSALAFGFVNAKQAYFPIDRMEFKKLTSNKRKIFAGMSEITDDCYMFWLENVKPGKFKLDLLVGQLGQSNIFVELNETFRVKRSGLYFIGAFKITRKSARKIDFRSASEPDEKEVLTSLLKLSKGTKWQTLIQKRINKLK